MQVSNQARLGAFADSLARAIRAATGHLSPQKISSPINLSARITLENASPFYRNTTKSTALVCGVVLGLLGANDAIAACTDSDNNEDELETLGLSLDFQLPLNSCPISPARTRGKDELAKEGGGFYANRGENGCHFAIDLEYVADAPKTGFGEPVHAAAKGTVRLASSSWGSAGNTVIVDHGHNLYTLYAHLDEVGVEVGSVIDSGDRIGTVGYSGNAEALKKANLPPHLHFTVFKTTNAIAEIKPLSVVKETEKANDQLPFLKGFGFIDPSDWLRGHGCL